MLSFKRYLMEELGEDFYERHFHRQLKHHFPKGVDVYHETPGHVAHSIKKHGLGGDNNSSADAVFGTVGKHSDFVESKHKTITHFRVPHTHSHYISPDMRYDPDKPHTDLMKQHPSTKGADVSVNVDRIPHHWVQSIKEVD